MMRITCLGTRGYIDTRTRRHYRHTATLIEYQGTRVMIDCGADWVKKVYSIDPDAIIITHAHPDHAWGLMHGSPCPVYATQASWDIIKRFPISATNTFSIKAREVYTLGSIIVEPFFVEHSIRCPAIGYRITAGKTSLFYSGDIVSIPERRKALSQIALYIGDGATVNRSLVRQKEGKLFGHASIKTQLGWCKKEQVPLALFTHCGSQIVAHDGRTIGAYIRGLGRSLGVHTMVAYDGLQIVL